MLNEGKKCRKTTYSIKKIMPCPRGARHYYVLVSLLFNLRKASDEVAKEVAGCLNGCISDITDTAHEWHFKQNAVGFVQNNSSVLRRNVRRSLRYVSYAPIETTSNFFSNFVRSLSEIEE